MKWSLARPDHRNHGGSHGRRAQISSWASSPLISVTSLLWPVSTAWANSLALACAAGHHLGPRWRRECPEKCGRPPGLTKVSEPAVRTACDCTGRPGRDSSFGALWGQKCPESAVSSAEPRKVDGAWPLVRRRSAAPGYGPASPERGVAGPRHGDFQGLTWAGMTSYRFLDASLNVVATGEFPDHAAALTYARNEDEHDEDVQRVEYLGEEGRWRWAGALQN